MPCQRVKSFFQAGLITIFNLKAFQLSFDNACHPILQ